MMSVTTIPPDRRPVLVAAVRTPVGRFLGGLSALTAPQLGGIAIRAAITRAGIDPSDVDDAYVGCVLQAGVGMAPAKQAALEGGLPESVPATTVNKVCGSGLMAVAIAARQIMLGEASVVVAAGMESMSRAPFLNADMRLGHKAGDATLIDAMIHDGLWSPWDRRHVGHDAEAIAARHGATRESQDAWALRSHMRAITAIDSGAFADEIVPVVLPGRRGGPPVVVSVDECPRRDTSAEALAALRPVFVTHPSPSGAVPTVTAGNASQLADGAAAVIVTSEAFAMAHGVPILARYIASANASLAPEWLFEAPAPTIHRLLDRTGTTLDDYDLFELNEAYAAQMVADSRLIGWDEARVNVHGGSIALGHALGSTGTRILTTLTHALRRHDGHRGIAAACLGGGEAFAVAIERP
jgi:acetyl-CoA C-acetyltransferase